MRRLMIAAVAVAVAGLALVGQGVAHAQGNNSTQFSQPTGPQNQGVRRQFDQVQQPFDDDVRQSVVTLPTPGWDDDNNQGTGGSGSLRTDTLEEKGIIRSVSDKGLTLSIPEKDRIVTLHADGQVRLLRANDEPLALSSLQVGDEVRASYQFNEEGEKVLRGLEVTQDSTAQAKKAKKK
jgi:hypothetical protein